MVSKGTIFAISKDKEWYRISQDPQQKIWYKKTIEVNDELKLLKKGDIVELIYAETSSGKEMTSIKKIGENPASSYSSGYGNKDTSEQIKRCAVGNMVSRILPHLKGVSEANSKEKAIELYQLFLDLINKKYET